MNDIKQVQAALNAAGADLKVDGVWGPKTQAAFEKYRGVVDTGYNWYGTEANRQRMNTEHLGGMKIEPHTISGTADLDAYKEKYGQYGMDGTGGVFNREGYSSNPTFLQQQAGITRGMTRGTPLESLSDKAIQRVVRYGSPWLNNSYIDPVSGVVSSVREAGMVSLGDIRKAYADLTNQQASYSDGVASMAAPFAKPHYYDGQLNSDLKSKQKEQLDTNIWAMTTLPGGFFPVVGYNAGRWSPAPPLHSAGRAPVQTASDQTERDQTTSDQTVTATNAMTDDEWLRYVARLSGLEGW